MERNSLERPCERTCPLIYFDTSTNSLTDYCRFRSRVFSVLFTEYRRVSIPINMNSYSCCSSCPSAARAVLVPGSYLSCISRPIIASRACRARARAVRVIVHRWRPARSISRCQGGQGGRARLYQSLESFNNPHT